ncbi:hypothetical protein QYF61_007156 [Mycteria americana]|uniref:Rna-directed dna polymerase from mobile element jockey-like n=1 Tax=Mycteria americana TaxID=33587 RepID=A0AAN7RZ57_MYCAM|nr:hypothetical protein QYF61_007156 [Mycteria americana]
MVGLCYRRPKQDEKTDEIFYKQLGEVSQSLALVLVGDINLPDVCWKYNTAERKQSGRFLECVADNFLTQLVSEPTREGARWSSCSRTEKDLGQTLACLGDWLTRVPWEGVLKDKGVLEGWAFFKKGILKVQEQAIPMCQKTSWYGKSLAWLNRELWLELRKQKRVYDLWKKVQATQDNYKNVMTLRREKIRRAKAQLGLNLATAIKDDKKYFYKYISNKRRTEENLHPLLAVGGNIKGQYKDWGKSPLVDTYTHTHRVDPSRAGLRHQVYAVAAPSAGTWIHEPLRPPAPHQLLIQSLPLTHTNMHTQWIPPVTGLGHCLARYPVTKLEYLGMLLLTFTAYKTSFLRRGSGERGADLFSLVSSDRTHRNGSKLCQGRFRLDVRKHFFTERVVKPWKRFPREVVDAPSLSVFKKHLDNALGNML